METRKGNNYCNYADLKYKERKLKETLNIDGTQAEIILYLDKKAELKECPSIGEIGDYLDLSEPNTSGKITDLWKRKYVEKTFDKDNQRKRKISLTKKGKNLTDKLKRYFFEE